MISTVDGIQQELGDAQAEQMGLNPDKFPFGMMGGQGGMMRSMGAMGSMGGVMR